MKINIFFLIASALFFSDCTAPKYLPYAEDVYTNEYGAYINIILPKGDVVEGELIAIDSSNIVVLTEETRSCTTVSLDEVKYFKLRYAKARNYGWSIPVFVLSSLTHGVGAIITLPLNLVVTIVVTATGQSAFQYNHRNMTYDKMRMYARFPQGIPRNVSIHSIE